MEKIMLIEAKAGLIREVGELSLNDICNYCLTDFAGNLRELLRDWNGQGGTWNYKTYSDKFCNTIKYNSKSIVFEETIYNDPVKSLFSVEDTCVASYGLTLSSDTLDTLSKYTISANNVSLNLEERACPEGQTITDENLCNFYKYFGLGEFPYMTITVIRLGNKDHFFYTIHR